MTRNFLPVRDTLNTGTAEHNTRQQKKYQTSRGKHKTLNMFMFTTPSIYTFLLLLSLSLIPTHNAHPSQFCKIANAAPSSNITTIKPTPILLTCPELDIATTTTVPSFKICLRPAFEKDYVSTIIQKLGVWEPINTARITNLLTLQKTSTKTPAQHVVIDIGAHLGWYTLLAASHGFSVVAFEPLRAQRERLQASVLLNGFEELVTIMPYAVSNTAGYSTIWTGNGLAVVEEKTQTVHSNTGGSWIKPKGWTANEAAEYAHVSEIGIETVLLDQALDVLNINEIFLIKIDIEGHLGLALSEGEKTLKRAKFLFLELTPKIEALNGCNMTFMMQDLYHQGFQICYPPQCLEGGCSVENIPLGEMETCLPRIPNVRTGVDGGDSDGDSSWVWSYEDVLLAKIAAPSKINRVKGEGD